MPSGRELEEILYQALSSPLGLELRVSDFPAAAARLNQAKKASGDPELKSLQCRHSPHNPEAEMWLVKGGVKPREALGIPEGVSPGEVIDPKNLDASIDAVLDQTKPEDQS